MTSAIERRTRRAGPGGWPGVLAAAVLVVLVGASCAGKAPAEVATDELNAGLQAHVAGNLDEASKHYKECLKQEATNKLCNYNLGLIAQTQGRNDEAENDYRLTLVQDPAYAPALYNLAIIRSAAGSNDEAIDLYKKVIAVQPDNASAYLNMGLLLVAAGKTDEGKAALAKAVQLDPTLASRLPSAPPSGTQAPGSSEAPTKAP